MSILLQDLSARLSPEPVDHFDRLPDPILLIILDNISDVKSLGRCSSVSRRFHFLVPQVHSVLVRVDCVIPEEDDPSPCSKSGSNSPISSFFRQVLGNITRPLLAMWPVRREPLSSLAVKSLTACDDDGGGGVTHHSPAQVLRNFNELKFLRIELPTGELGIDDGSLLKWRANFGSTLESCVILGASSVIHPDSSDHKPIANNTNHNNDDNGSIPESFYTNGGLKLRVVWTISSLIAASARHYLLQTIIADHSTLTSLVLTDADGQGVLCMNKDQLEDMRVKPLSASLASKRTLVPALSMRLWYAQQLELPDGMVLKGATLVAIRPSEGGKEADDGLSWVGEEGFDEPYRTAARMLVKRKTYCLEMNSF